MKPAKPIILGLSLIFGACMKEGKKEYTYLKEKNRSIEFWDNPNNEKDHFHLSVGPWLAFAKDGVDISIHYKGVFNKDSVDKAVAQYLEDGTVPSYESLK